jgi:hypothetical protein
VSAIGLEKAKLDTEYCLNKVYVKVQSVERPTYGDGKIQVRLELLHSQPAIEESQEESGEESESESESDESGAESEGADEANTRNETTGVPVREAPDYPRSAVSPGETGL